MCDMKLFESIRVEPNLHQVASHENKVLLNVSYNPQKSFPGLFIDDLSGSIGMAMLRTTNTVLMGDYKINFPN